MLQSFGAKILLIEPSRGQRSPGDLLPARPKRLSAARLIFVTRHCAQQRGSVLGARSSALSTILRVGRTTSIVQSFETQGSRRNCLGHHGERGQLPSEAPASFGTHERS